MSVNFIMPIKSSKEQQPEQNLKFISFIDDLQSTQALHQVTPERINKEWVMDAWEDHSQYDASSPQKNKYINKMIQNHDIKSFRLKKVEFFSEKVVRPEKISTPLREKQDNEIKLIEKENKSRQASQKRIRSRLYSTSKPAKRSFVNEEIEGPFKMPISSVLYPVSRQKEPERLTVYKGGRRIERFHSFVARSIRR